MAGRGRDTVYIDVRSMPQSLTHRKAFHGHKVVYNSEILYVYKYKGRLWWCHGQKMKHQISWSTRITNPVTNLILLKYKYPPETWWNVDNFCFIYFIYSPLLLFFLLREHGADSNFLNVLAQYFDLLLRYCSGNPLQEQCSLVCLGYN